MSARCNPTCDPIHHAGYLTCPICDAPGWPSEAIWLDENFIAATYVPSCAHVEKEVLVVGGPAS